MTEDWVYDGLIDDALLAFRLGRAVADSDAIPLWYRGDEFEGRRQIALAAEPD